MRRALVIFVWLVLSACHSWQPVSTVAPQGRASPLIMRVTLLDSSQVVIHDASLNAIGVRGWTGFLGSRTLFSQSRAQLQAIEVRQPDLESTVFVTVVAAVTTMMFFRGCANNTVFCPF